MKKRILLVAAIVLLMAAVAFSAQAATETVDLTAFKCPCSQCGGKPYTGTWITAEDVLGGTSIIDPVDGAHYYINSTLTQDKQINIGANEEVVFLLDNATLQENANSRLIGVNSAGAVLHVIGNNGKLAGPGLESGSGVVAMIGNDTAQLHLYGDLTVERTAASANTATSAGLFRMYKGLLHIHDCDGMGLPTDKDPVLKAPSLKDKTEAKGGIAVLENASCTFTMDAGTLNGTNQAYAGGAIYVTAGAAHINGGTINGGTVVHGGAIYVASGTVTIGNDANNATGATVNGGTADTGASGTGGAVYVESGSTVTMGAKGAIAGGTAWRGGCVYVKGTFQMNGGTMSGGKATNQGGLAFVSGTFNMAGGTATANTANTSNACGFRVQGGKMNMSGNARVVSAGKALGDGIDLLRTDSNTAAGVLTLADNACVVGPNGEQTNNIRVQNYKQKSSKLEIKAGWTGTASVWFEYLFATNTNKTADYSVGMTIDSAYGASGAYTGSLSMEGAPNRPPLYHGENNTLQVASVQLCTYNLPKLDAVWFQSPTAAAAAAQEGQYIGIYAAGLTMDISEKDILADFNGFDCAVTGTGKLSIMDAAGDDYEGALAKITYHNVASAALNPYNDRQYVALPNDDGTWSAHRVDLRISAVNVRPTTAGVYYSAQLDCDAALKEVFQNAGVAVNLESIPGFDYAQTSHYTRVNALDADGFTGVLINQILKNGADNQDRGNRTIYANAYVDFLVGGQKVTVLADPYNVGLTKGNFLPGHRYVAYSLNDAMQAMDLRWRYLEEAEQQSVLTNLYHGYNGIMQDWNLRFINAHVTGEPVKELKVLTIGNSLSVDAGHMLGYIAKIEGMESIRIGTLYYGGCTQQQHASFLTNNAPEYRWYDTNITDLQNADIADTVPEVSLKKADQITMYEGIVMDDWDIIITQQGVWQAGMPETHEKDLDTVIAYVRKHATNPNAILMWNMIWAAPVEAEMMAKASNGIPPDASGFEAGYKQITGFDVVKDNKEAQDTMFALIRNAVQTKILPNAEFADVIPGGTGQQNALWSGLSDADLYRDYIHASDLARYIYSYLWYCKLTGADFDGVASTSVPLAVRYIKKDDISEIPPATEALDLTQNDNYLLNIVNHSIRSALSDPFTPKGIND